MRFAADLILATPLEVMAAFLPALRRHDEHEALAALLDKQVLVVNGTGDLLTPPARSEEIVERLPGSVHVVVEESGHLIMLEHPVVVTGQVLALIDRAEADAAAGVAASDRPRVRRKVIDIAKEHLVRRARAEAKTGSKGKRQGQEQEPGLLVTGHRLDTAKDTRDFGEALAAGLRAGDLVILTGGLGAGKTTLTQGLAAGLGVRGPITSPTFVIARVHPSLGEGPALVHVDAYRLGGLAELDDLDLDTSLEESVTVVEWGHGLAEDLSDDRLEVTPRGRSHDRVPNRRRHRARRALEGWPAVLILAIDTSTSAITVALHDEERAIAPKSHLDARAHTEWLAPLIESCLTGAGKRPTDLTGVAIGVGPGPFTGLRVGMVTGLTMGHALDVPVHGVCGLDVLAHQASRLVDGELLVATDARRKEVYWSRYAVRPGVVERLTDPAVDRPADLPDAVRSLPAVGRGPVLYPELFTRPLPVLDVDAAVLGRVAVARILAGEPMPVDPLYLRRPDALTTAERAART